MKYERQRTELTNSVKKMVPERNSKTQTTDRETETEKEKEGGDARERERERDRDLLILWNRCEKKKSQYLYRVSRTLEEQCR